MKKKVAVVLAILLLIASIMLVACKTDPIQLDTPTITLSGYTVTWGSVDNAAKYEVKVNDKTTETDKLTYTLTPTEPGEYTISVKALAAKETFTDSNESNKVTCIVKQSKLAAPVLTKDGNIISWQAVPNAGSYQVYVDGTSVGTQTTLSYTVEQANAGSYSITVKALAGSKLFTDSDMSLPQIYTVDAKALSAPVITINQNVVSWTAVTNAIKYKVFVNDVAQDEQTALSYTVSEAEVGTYSVKVVALGDGTNYLDSKASNVVKYTVAPNQLKAPQISISGKVVTWSAVEHAGKYEIFVNGVSKGKQTERTYTLTETVVGTYSVKVVAIAESASYVDSVASNAVQCVIEPTKLIAPQISLSGNTVSWTSVENAGKYQVFVNGASKAEITALSYTITETAIGDYSIQVVAKSASAQYADSDKSNTVKYTVAPTPLPAPEAHVSKDVVSWNAIANADGYDVYVNNVRKAEGITDTSFVLLDAGEFDIEIVAVGSGAYLNSEKSNAVSAVVKGAINSRETVAGETFETAIRLVGDDVAKITVTDNHTQYVWLRYFVKADKPTEYRIVLEGETRKIIVDWNTVGGVKVEKSNRLQTLSGETTVDYEYVAVQLDLMNVTLGGEYKFTIETRTSGATLSVTGFTVTQMLSDKYSMKYHPNEFIFNDNVKVGDFGITEDDVGTTPYYYSNFVPYGTLKTFWGGWLTFSYSNLAPDAEHYNYNDDNKYQAMSRYITFDNLGNNDCYQLYMFYGNDARDSHMLWKFTAFDPLTGETYILKDWFVWISGTAGENECLITLDSEASKAVSGKNVILTWQCQSQEGVTGIVNRLFVRNWAIRMYSAPVVSDEWNIVDGNTESAWNGEQEVKINSDTFIGELILKGAGNTATLTTQIDPAYSNNAWITFFARAGESISGAATPSTMFKLTATIGDGTSVTLIDWYKIGGTNTLINKGTAEASPVTIANDDYEIFMISIDNFAHDYAGKTVVLTLEQKDSEDDSVQELHVTGFTITQREAIVKIIGKYEGMSDWTTNWDNYVEFTDYPIPGGFLRMSATTSDLFKYQGEATTVSFENLQANDVLKFEMLYGNYGNYGSIVHKLMAIDCDTGAVYNLIDWEFLSYPGGGDLQYSYTIDAEIVAKLAGKINVQLIWQFNDSQKLDSVYDNRLYVKDVGFVVESAGA